MKIYKNEEIETFANGGYGCGCGCRRHNHCGHTPCNGDYDFIPLGRREYGFDGCGSRDFERYGFERDYMRRRNCCGCDRYVL